MGFRFLSLLAFATLKACCDTSTYRGFGLVTCTILLEALPLGGYLPVRPGLENSQSEYLYEIFYSETLVRVSYIP